MEKSGKEIIGLFVLDCSLAISWCIEDEHAESTEAVLDSLALGSRAVVPSLWVFEVNNVLLMAERAGRLSKSKRQEQIGLLQKLPIDVDTDGHKTAWTATAALAQEHNLTMYDAAYLELARRQRLPLGSLDKSLRNVARKLHVKCLPA